MVVEALLCLAAFALLLPQAIVLIETLGALLPRRARPADGGPVPRTAVLIPAHNEAGQIGATVRSLKRQLQPGDRLIVIADNCDDETAAVARAAGAAVIERNDRERRGKGFAISFAVAHLEPDAPEVVVIVDADCEVSSGGIPFLSALAVRLDRPIQAEYLLGAPPNPGPVAVVNALAVLVRSGVRPRGLHRFGMPCHLAGSGMAFPWKVLHEAPDTGSELVEDLVMGIEMALAGKAAQFCPEVRVRSELPVTKGAAMSQRRRWEHGTLATLTKFVPRLLASGLVGGRVELLGLGFDLLVPPLALLVMMQLGVLTAAVTAAAIGITSWLPAQIAAAGFAALTFAIGTAWVIFGRKVAPLRYAFFIPVYVLWKIPLYLSLALRGKQKTWERTARRSESDRPSGDREPTEIGS